MRPFIRKMRKELAKGIVKLQKKGVSGKVFKAALKANNNNLAKTIRELLNPRTANMTKNQKRNLRQKLLRGMC